MQMQVTALGHTLQKDAQFQWVLAGCFKCAHRALLRARYEGRTLRDANRTAHQAKTEHDTANVS